MAIRYGVCADYTSLKFIPLCIYIILVVINAMPQGPKDISMILCCFLTSSHVLILLAAVSVQWAAYGSLPADKRSDHLSVSSAVLSSVSTLANLGSLAVGVCCRYAKRKPPKRRIKPIYILFILAVAATATRCITTVLSAVKAAREVNACDNSGTDSGDGCSSDTVNLLISVPILEVCSMISVVLLTIYGCYMKKASNSQSTQDEVKKSLVHS